MGKDTGTQQWAEDASCAVVRLSFWDEVISERHTSAKRQERTGLLEEECLRHSPALNLFLETEATVCTWAV